MTVDSCTRKFVWSYSFTKQQQAQQHEWLSIDIFELFLWLSFQACVSLFDDDSFPQQLKHAD